MSSRGKTLSRLAAAIAVDVGLLTALTPTFAMRLYGVPQEQLTGAAQFGLRMFGVRAAMVGGAALAGNDQAKAMVLAVQVPDQVIMWHALATGYLPRRTAVLALLTSSAIFALSAAAYLSEQGESESEPGIDWDSGPWEDSSAPASGSVG